MHGKIQAQKLLHFCLRYLVLVLKQNTCIVFSAWCLTYRNRFQNIIIGNVSVLSNFNFSYFGQCNRSVFKFDIVIYAYRCITFLMIFSWLEFRKPNFFISEKILPERLHFQQENLPDFVLEFIKLSKFQYNINETLFKSTIVVVRIAPISPLKSEWSVTVEVPTAQVEKFYTDNYMSW